MFDTFAKWQPRAFFFLFRFIVIRNNGVAILKISLSLGRV